MTQLHNLFWNPVGQQCHPLQHNAEGRNKPATASIKKKKINQEAKRVRKLYQENISMNVFSSIIAGINLHKIHLL